MGNIKSKFLAILGVLFLLGIFVGTAGGGTRYRGLEKLLDQHEFSVAEEKRIIRSYSSALRAGLAKKEALSLVQTCLEGQFDARQISRILSLAAQVELANLLHDGFISKVKEGVAKGVPAAKVLEVAERRALMMKKAENILNSIVLEGFDIGDRDELLLDVAGALESGRDAGEVQRIITSSLENQEGINQIRRKLLP